MCCYGEVEKCEEYQILLDILHLKDNEVDKSMNIESAPCFPLSAFWNDLM